MTIGIIEVIWQEKTNLELVKIIPEMLTDAGI